MTQYGGDMKQESHKTDEYVQKNPLDSTTASDHMKMGNTGTKGTGAGHGNEEGKHGGTGGILHQTGSGSSSSSEDDGEGGRRKKKGGVMGKIKEKLPGGKPGAGDEQFKTSATATTVGAGGGHGYEGEEAHEKKGMMDKIKEKLPGANK